MSDKERIEETSETTVEIHADTRDGERRSTVDFFVHESDMMQKDVDNERLHKTIREICITFILIIIVFVASYTIRTSVWLNTIDRMNAAVLEMAMLHHSTGAEVADGIHEQPDN